MKISWNYLQSFFSDALDKKVVFERLTMAGLEVEDETALAPLFSGVVVGEVISCVKHPSADKLSVCMVNAGAVEPLQIICGASNVASGVKVPCAEIGALLPDGFKIEKRNMRGLISHGVLCSGAELGIPTEAEGLLLLGNDAVPGQDIRKYLDLDDSIIEFKITPNRGDCLSYLGLVREIYALTNYKLKKQEQLTDYLLDEASDFELKVSAPNECQHYIGLIISNIDNRQSSPQWLTRILARSGVRSISLLVDITNYVLLIMGQPMHAFDLAKLAGGIGVRLATGNEKLQLLDGTNASIMAGSLLITDGNDKPVALAGIMGGMNSAINPETTAILLESAYFAPDVIQGKSRLYGVSSDAAYRYERGVDINLQHDAINLAAKLVLEICGGKVGKYVHFVANRKPLPKITINYAQIDVLIGQKIEHKQIGKILQDLGCSIIVEEHDLVVTPPSYRFDLKIPEDLVEEIIRVYGYDKINAQMPVLGYNFNSSNEKLLRINNFKTFLAMHGFNEIISYAFIEEHFALLLADKDKPVVKIKNPIAGLGIMRNNLVADLIKALQYNLNRGYDSLKIFEVARVFHGEDENSQPQYVAGLVYGKYNGYNWSEPTRMVDFYDLKQIIEEMLAKYATIMFEPCSNHALCHPGRTALIKVGATKVGYIGQLHPRLLQPLSLDLSPYVFELNLDILPQEDGYRLNTVSKYQKVKRDLAFVVDKDTSASSISTAILKLGIVQLKSCEIFDVFAGGNLDLAKKSMAFNLMFQGDRTLSDDEVNAYLDMIKQMVLNNFNGSLR